METVQMIILLVYLAAGIWAVPRTLWANKVVYGSFVAILVRKVFWGFALGWCLIPWAIIKGRK